jgi:hypothetical protein
MLRSDIRANINWISSSTSDRSIDSSVPGLAKDYYTLWPSRKIVNTLWSLWLPPYRLSHRRWWSGPTTIVSLANLMMVLEPQVNMEYRKGLSRHPWGVPVLRVSMEDMMLPTLTTWDGLSGSPGSSYKLLPTLTTWGRLIRKWQDPDATGFKWELMWSPTASEWTNWESDKGIFTSMYG